MSFASIVRARLSSLGHGQKDLARTAQVTESYVSQLLTRKKPPPDPERTDIYSKMEGFLGLEAGELGRLAEAERTEERRRKLGPTQPLFREFRELLVRKCVVHRREEVRAVFDARPFGTLERLVAGTMLELVQRIARQELDNEDWIRLAARVGGRSNEAMRVIVLEFLDTDVFHVSSENCLDFLDPLVESWDVDLETLRLDVTLRNSLVEHPKRTFRFVESEDRADPDEMPGLAEFLRDQHPGDPPTAEEVRLLALQSFRGRRPNKLYYYRALQNLRDPLHFSED